MEEPQRAVTRSVRIYRRLLRVYPGSFKSRFGDATTEVFEQLLIDALYRRGWRGFAKVWAAALLDLVVSAFREHVSQLRATLTLKTAALAVVSNIAAIAVYYNLLILITLFWLVWLRFATIPPFALDLWTPSPRVELLWFFVPALLTGVVVSQVKPFFKPVLTAAVGPIAFAIVFLLPGSSTSWALRFGFVAGLGLTASMACAVLVKRASRRSALAPPDDPLPVS